MKVILSLLIFFFSSSIFSMELSFKGQSYELEKIGEMYFVYKKHYKVDLNEIGHLDPIDCNKLSGRVNGIEWIISRCRKDVLLSLCRAKGKSLLFQGTESPYQNPEILYPVKRKWEISFIPVLTEDEKKELEIYIRKNFSLEKSKLSFILNPPLNPSAHIATIYQEGSLGLKIDPIMASIPKKLMRPTLIGDLLQVENRFFSCDLKRNKVKVQSGFQIELGYTKKTSEEELHKIWKVYKIIENMVNGPKFDESPKLLQAAKIGYMIATGIEKNNIDKDKYSLESLFNSFFDISDGELNIEKFEQKEDLKDKKYSDIIFSKKVNVKWSNSP